jgi:hypothetical protein
LKQQTYPSEYAAPISIETNHWMIHKFCSHHGTYLGTYHIRVMEFDGKIEFVCTCQAGRGCKHIRMVVEMLNPKKDLF